MNSRLKPKKRVMLAYLIPSAVVYFCVFIIPVILAVYYSFFNFKTVKKKTFIGLKNYVTLLHDANVLTAFKNNIFLVIVCLIGQVGIAFLLANILHSRLIRSRISNLMRTIIYFPVTLSAVIIGYVWWAVYDYNFGLLNQVLKLVGLGKYADMWLANSNTVMGAISIPMIWQYVGFHLVILVSAMAAIDPQIYDSAMIDGASGFQITRYITFPLIRPTLGICIILCISANLKAFDHIVAMTNGGPGYSSMVLALYAYRVSFENVNLGYGNTISVVIMVVMVTIFSVSRACSERLSQDPEERKQKGD